MRFCKSLNEISISTELRTKAAVPITVRIFYLGQVTQISLWHNFIICETATMSKLTPPGVTMRIK